MGLILHSRSIGPYRYSQYSERTMSAKILVVDDSLTARKMISGMLSEYNVLTAFDGKDALRSIDDNPDIDLVILDLNMPVMDGWQFLDEFVLLPIKKEISVFIMTSSIDPVDIEMAKKYKIVKDYVEKPITTKKLDVLCKLIGNTN